MSFQGKNYNITVKVNFCGFCSEGIICSCPNNVFVFVYTPNILTGYCQYCIINKQEENNKDVRLRRYFWADDRSRGFIAAG